MRFVPAALFPASSSRLKSARAASPTGDLSRKFPRSRPVNSVLVVFSLSPLVSRTAVAELLRTFSKSSPAPSLPPKNINSNPGNVTQTWSSAPMSTSWLGMISNAPVKPLKPELQLQPARFLASRSCSSPRRSPKTFSPSRRALTFGSPRLTDDFARLVVHSREPAGVALARMRRESGCFLLPYYCGCVRHRKSQRHCELPCLSNSPEGQRRLLETIRHLLHTLYDVEGLIRSAGPSTPYIVCLIVFVETGFFVGFFLPGDSLLVTAGVFAAGGLVPLRWLLFPVMFCAIVGDQIGYWIGRAAGNTLYKREDSFFFRRRHLQRAHDFYEKYGGKTVILARFIPIIRTSCPPVAGAARMPYTR